MCNGLTSNYNRLEERSERLPISGARKTGHAATTSLCKKRPTPAISRDKVAAIFYLSD